jgi:hypothetical protein
MCDYLDAQELDFATFEELVAYLFANGFAQEVTHG